MKDGKSGCRAHFACEVEMRRRAHAGDRYDIGERRVGFDMPADDVEEIDLAGIGKTLRDFDAFGPRNPGCEVLVGHHAHADHELRPDGFPHRIDHAA